jgi:hypothetical protein
MASQTFVDTAFFDPGEEFTGETLNGIVFHFVAPRSGRLLMDLGHIGFDEEEDVVFTGGPHDFLEGNTEALCAYLAEP